MGIPKHGKLSSRTKNSARYKSEGRRAINKAHNIEKQNRHEEKQKAKRRERESYAHNV